jgi:hypothetical protein
MGLVNGCMCTDRLDVIPIKLMAISVTIGMMKASRCLPQGDRRKHRSSELWGRKPRR